MRVVLFGIVLQHALSLRLCMRTASTPKTTREFFQREVARTAFQAAVLTAAVALPSSQAAQARVYFDTDVYGDKELKIATVNKIKQKLRNAILEDAELAPQLLQLSLSDALGFQSSNQEGGPDGSIQFKIGDGKGVGLEKGIAALMKIKKELQRTNTVAFADLCAFGGAEALETAGCGRMIVQVGRFDAKAAGTAVPPELSIDWRAPDANILRTRFENSGLDARDLAVLIGSLGEVKRVVAETLEAKANEGSNEDEDDAEFEAQPFVPTTFGSREAMYGAKMGKGDFGVKYFKDLLSGKDKVGGVYAQLLLDDPKVKTFVQKYAGNEAAFLKDVPEVYLRLTLLGQTSTTRNAS